MSIEVKINKRKGKATVRSCNVNEEVLFDFVEGELDPTLLGDLKIHLNNCSSCQDGVAQFQWIKGQVKTSVSSVAHLPDDKTFAALHDKIMGSLDRKVTEVAPVYTLWTRRVLAPVAGAAAAVALVFGSLYKAPSFSSSNPVALDRLGTAEEQFLVQTASTDPDNFGNVIISHQDSDDLVLSATAEKLSHMSDDDVREALDNLK